jgi:lipoprotein-anchoring transpeptidase ErfK/SrfK
MEGMNMLINRRLMRIGASAVALAAIAVAGVTAGSASAAPAAPARATAVAEKAAASKTKPWTPPKRTLVLGMTGSDVKSVQERLNSLHYYAGPNDGNFGSDTEEAVWAFQEVNHIKVTGDIDAATKKALVSPTAYKAKYPGQAGTRVEVNLGLGVLVFFKDHKIALVSHISSGGHYYYDGDAYAETPTGEFRALYFVSGWDQGPLGAMYNPTFFNYDGDAIHGEYNSAVPLEPVSHGCVRIPYDIAGWFYKDLTISENGNGTEVWVYNQWTTWTQGDANS